MNSKFIILDCNQEQNFIYNDNVDLCKDIYTIFKNDDDIQAVEIFLLDDDYIEYLKKNNFEDNALSRKEYIETHPRKDYNQAFINSTYSEIIDPTILPVSLFNEKLENRNFEIRILDDMRKKLSEYLERVVNNGAANPVFGGGTTKKIWISSNIFRLDEKLFENEQDFVDEILYASNYGISDKYKKLKFVDSSLFTLGFIYIIGIIKIPRVITKDMSKNFIVNTEDIINFEISIEEIEKIIQKEGNPQTFVMANYLIYPNEINEVIEGWKNYMEEEIIKELDACDKMDAITANHTKRRKS